ncbi:5'-methylthioadenosine/adenosylhomocysteine nucleosidase [Paenibacillus glucanolyticus]|jgi:adenosylhomocysteine nucleosidase|uniref:5'-methylthioadenosine/adenosylhomocysteine nucleosidase n=1 Tax=Paenibacillus TaxID=44249 RepID=UPI0003E1C4CE|nr:MULTISPECIES: 5'-methylthioadenosine/adenosylhomocysteine nucleosidase [Paenibacillus]ANA81780.1 5'-methylthioadenosine/S-adenosylhomocysteine nucleosidase [Paenibacillus glucanolyticus]AVV59489.1 5'-methylthioadenosine/adenosylhomocysteine nucleosidase [Paenibacillus glucanolyticus]ETT43195.1 adenosylhomocysteine nucleosidase [Paenibacillus sp. FSL R5-808]MPY15978.1 5'-methylthioadenosine/adenosylhomocysteine nucleosidase [Paenibacillus glucanolyticus]
MTTQVIGLIGAMDEEVELLLGQLENKVTTVKAGVTYASGTLHGKQVVVCKSGVGKVNAAVTTQILIDSFGVSKILFTGVAGALHPDLNIGDIVISSSCMQHDMDVTPLGFARGMIPYQEVSDFPADQSLIELAEEACKELSVDHYVIGKVLSGDQFIASRETVQTLYEDLNGACAEMEGSAVAQVCYMNRVPYVVIRSMSDKADGSAHVNFPEFTVKASRRSHEIVNYMLGRL